MSKLPSSKGHQVFPEALCNSLKNGDLLRLSGWPQPCNIQNNPLLVHFAFDSYHAEVYLSLMRHKTVFIQSCLLLLARSLPCFGALLQPSRRHRLRCPLVRTPTTLLGASWRISITSWTNT